MDFKRKENKSCFAYVADLSEDMIKEINDIISSTHKFFGIKSTDGKRIATEIYEIVDDILKTNKFPKEYSNMDEVAVALGVYYGYAVCNYYNWSWKMLGATSEEDACVSIVSPNKYYSIQPLHYIRKILTRNNIGLNGENDNTVLLLFNMIETTYCGPEENEYIPLS